MKKLLINSLAFALLTTNAPIQCSASAKALRYLQAAGAAAWQGTKKTTQWITKNPYKVTGSLFAASTYSAVKIHQNTSNQLAAYQFEPIARTTMDLKQLAPIMTIIKDTCREHGIEDPLVLITPTTHCDLLSMRHKDRMFILITTGAVQQMLLDIAGEPSDFKMKHWNALLIHEIKHLLANDSRKALIIEGALQTEKFKTEAFTALTFGTGIHAITKAISKLPASPKVRAVVAGYLTAQGLIVAKTMEQIEKKSTIFSDTANEWSKWFERRADSYVKETAFKTKNPQLLDDFAEWAKIHIKRGDIRQCPAHPLMEKRADDARAAAAELRALMEKGEIKDESIGHLCLSA
jgi:hypothetical protein